MEIINELKGCLKTIDSDQAEELVDNIIGAKRIFVAGAGRSLLMMRGLAMRLMHMGFTSYVIGETVTPAINADDLLIIGSGSGETASLVVMAQKAKKINAKVGLITIYPQSTIGILADSVVEITANTPKVINTKPDKEEKVLQPGGNTFEQGLLIFNDAMIIRIIKKLDISNKNEVLMTRHANLE